MAVTLWIEMALNGLDISLTVAVSLGTTGITYTNGCNDDTIMINFLADQWPNDSIDQDSFTSVLLKYHTTYVGIATAACEILLLTGG